MTTPQTTSREERGQVIAQGNGQVRRIDEDHYGVKSQSQHGEYIVSRVGDEWVCECPDNHWRHTICKHIYAVDFSVQMRKEVLSHSQVIQEVNISNCRFCGSNNLKKDGLRKNKCGTIQKFYCRDCHHYFTVNIGFERMKHNPQAITTAMQLYFSGESLRNTQKSLKLIGVQVSHKTIFMWIKKYIALMKEYVETIKPNVSDTWRADEIYIKISGNQKYLFAMMDDETRFWIAQEVAETKFYHDARNLLKMSKDLMGKKPLTFITDGLKSYNEAYRREFFTTRNPRTEHIRHITIRGDKNNNKMERMNGEIRDREKVMRGLKTNETPILQGYQIYHNYVRPHMALDGKTPAEACGIKVEGNNKWLTIIQNASKERKGSGN
jgi:putative transposase